MVLAPRTLSLRTVVRATLSLFPTGVDFITVAGQLISDAVGRSRIHQMVQQVGFSDPSEPFFGRGGPDALTGTAKTPLRFSSTKR